MTVEFDRSFERSLKRLPDRAIRERLIRIIERLEVADDLASIPNIKKLSGFKTFYRIRVGEYRLGFEFISPDTVRLIIIAHRKDIYTVFPR